MKGKQHLVYLNLLFEPIKRWFLLSAAPLTMLARCGKHLSGSCISLLGEVYAHITRLTPSVHNSYDIKLVFHLHLHVCYTSSPDAIVYLVYKKQTPLKARIYRNDIELGS